MPDSHEFLPADRPYVVAEIGGNHGGDVDRAKEYISAAAETGADAAKFQLYRAENLITRDEPPLPLAGDEYDTQFERFKELELTREEWLELIDYCRTEGIDFSASVFGREMLEFVRRWTPFIKIASGDLTNVPLLRQAAATDKPIVLSTGFSTIAEIRTIARELPDTELILLHCMGCYPTADKDANLTMLEALGDEFNVPIGYSDHTIDTLASIAAAAKGARLIEKHFTLDKDQEVGDHRLSATPEEMASIVTETQRVFKMQGSRRGDQPYACEGEIRKNMRRSLATRKAVSAGDELTDDDLTALRPENGISPLRYEEIIGRTVAKDIDAKEILTESDLQ